MVANMIYWLVTLIEEIEHTLHVWADDMDPMAATATTTATPTDNNNEIHARFARAASSSGKLLHELSSAYIWPPIIA